MHNATTVFPKKLSDVSQIHITGIHVNPQHSKKAGQVHDVQTINIDIENSICQITHDDSESELNIAKI